MTGINKRPTTYPSEGEGTPPLAQHCANTGMHDAIGRSLQRLIDILGFRDVELLIIAIVDTDEFLEPWAAYRDNYLLDPRFNREGLCKGAEKMDTLFEHILREVRGRSLKTYPLSELAGARSHTVRLFSSLVREMTKTDGYYDYGDINDDDWLSQTCEELYALVKHLRAEYAHGHGVLMDVIELKQPSKWLGEGQEEAPEQDSQRRLSDAESDFSEYQHFEGSSEPTESEDSPTARLNTRMSDAGETSEDDDSDGEEKSYDDRASARTNDEGELPIEDEHPNFWASTYRANVGNLTVPDSTGNEQSLLSQSQGPVSRDTSSGQPIRGTEANQAATIRNEYVQKGLGSSRSPSVINRHIDTSPVPSVGQPEASYSADDPEEPSQTNNAPGKLDTSVIGHEVKPSYSPEHHVRPQISTPTLGNTVNTPFIISSSESEGSSENGVSANNGQDVPESSGPGNTPVPKVLRSNTDGTGTSKVRESLGFRPPPSTPLIGVSRLIQKATGGVQTSPASRGPSVGSNSRVLSAPEPSTVFQPPKSKPNTIISPGSGGFSVDSASQLSSTPKSSTIARPPKPKQTTRIPSASRKPSSAIPTKRFAELPSTAARRRRTKPNTPNPSATPEAPFLLSTNPFSDLLGSVPKQTENQFSPSTLPHEHNSPARDSPFQLSSPSTPAEISFFDPDTPQFAPLQAEDPYTGLKSSPIRTPLPADGRQSTRKRSETDTRTSGMETSGNKAGGTGGKERKSRGSMLPAGDSRVKQKGGTGANNQSPYQPEAQGPQLRSPSGVFGSASKKSKTANAPQEQPSDQLDDAMLLLTMFKADGKRLGRQYSVSEYDEASQSDNEPQDRERSHAGLVEDADPDSMDFDEGGGGNAGVMASGGGGNRTYEARSQMKRRRSPSP